MSEQSAVFDVSTAAGRLMAETDWAATPVGEPGTWPETLKVLVRTALSSRYPMLVLWGESYTQLYNDAYSALIGAQHPAAMGEDCRVTLAEGWPVLGPLIDEAMATGVASWVPALQLLLERAGYREEAYFSVSHAPATDDEGITRGVLTVCSEVTEQVVGERRLRLLQRLSLDEGGSPTVPDVADRIVRVLDEDPLDVPFAALYVREQGTLRRLAAFGPQTPETVRLDGDDPWGLVTAARGRPATFGLPEDVALTGGAFGDPVTEGIALPIPSSDPGAPLGVLVAGVSPSRALDELYRSFLDLLVQQVGVALRNAVAHEEERARAEALAELDRAKTDFFTNVSHEFRTPLTLMLGPLSDALSDDATPLPEDQAQRVATALRASRRLLKLVNNLLTFSSLEAGSVVAEVRPLDLAALTADVAAEFRAAIERGGITFDVDAPPLERPVWIDAHHWETVVSNLLSNALKFTFTGAIRVVLRETDAGIRLDVEDTGVGIPDEELPRLFDRFHRVRGATSRSHEGSGVGLSLVGEIVKLLGGSVDVSSTLGEGTRFTIELPWATLGAPARDTAGPFELEEPELTSVVTATVEEVESWTSPEADPPDTSEGAAAQPAGHRPTDESPPRILIADDNADMREHIVRLLREQGWLVTAVADGRAAMAALQQSRTDLLLTDVMMPGLDGFQLLAAIRSDPQTATLPVIVLSARAGEGASEEGFSFGADDYIVKPFESRDLVARVRGTLQMARQRDRHVEVLSGLAEAAAVITSGRHVDEAIGSLAEHVGRLTGAQQVAVRLIPRDGGEPLVIESVLTQDDEAGVRTYEVLSVPVVGKGDRELGAVEVWLSPTEAVLPQTRALLDPVARVLAAVVEEGAHIERETVVAATLQTALLPDRLPDIAGLGLAAAYRPAEDDVQVGGDWYDVLELDDGRVMLCIGDVAGRGLSGALMMAQLRAAVRAYALEGRSPALSVSALDELVSRLPNAELSTLLLCQLEVESGRLTWCSAGHPPPILVGPDGDAGWLETDPAPPLGAAFGVRPVEAVTTLPPGATLLFYTDGLIEDRTHQLDLGMPNLMSTVDASSGLEPAALVEAALATPGPQRTDDVAVLVVHRLLPATATPLKDGSLDLTVPRAMQSARRIRERLRAFFDEVGVTPDVAFDLLLGVSEAFNNAVEHAVDPLRDEVVVRARVEAAHRRIRLEVQDFGQWRERRPSMDRGHGASLMSASGSVKVVPGPEGTLVAIDRDL